MRGPQHADRGSGTVLGAALIMLAAMLLCAVTAAGQVIVCRIRAQGASDMAALTAALARDRGRDDPCALARRVSDAYGHRLVDCVLAAGDAQVTLAADTGVPLAGEVTVRSRAGPEACG